MAKKKKTKTPSNIIELPLHGRLTARKVANVVHRRARAGMYDDILILAYKANGNMSILSSNMTSAEANWMLDYAKEVIVSNAMNQDGD